MIKNYTKILEPSVFRVIILKKGKGNLFNRNITTVSNVDSLDWKDYGVEAIIQTVCEHKHLGNGSIILMHNGAKYTADALDTVIKSLKSAGYELVPISELIMEENYKMNHEGRQIAINTSMDN